MNKNKKIIKAVIAVVVAAALFTAGYFISGKLFPAKTETDAAETTATEETTEEITTEAEDEAEDEVQGDNTDSDEEEKSEYLYILTDEKFGSGKIEVSKAEYEYYCVSIYNTLLSGSFQYDYAYGSGAGVMYTGYDWTKLPDEQECPMEYEGETFDNYSEYISYVAREQILATKACVEYAQLNSITFTEDELKEIEAFIENNRKTVADGGMELEEYLKKFYGEGMTEELYIQITKEQYLLDKVDRVKSLLFDEYYTTEMIEAEYNENINSYGQVTMRDYIIVANKDDSGAVYEASMEAAKSAANAFAEFVSDDLSFKKQASLREKRIGNQKYAELLVEDRHTLLKNVTFEEVDMETSDKGLAPWAFDTSRKAGDIYIAEIKDVGYGVYMMVDPVHKPVSTYKYDIRHILISLPDDVERDTVTKIKLLNPAAYDVTVDIDIYPELTADRALYMKAQGVLEEYLAGDCTEESFAALAKQYSADGNAIEGGIYKDVSEGQMVSAFENWALEEGRKKGDVGIVETVYGYHIMYFVDKEIVVSWEENIKSQMSYNASVNFIKELSGKYNLDVEAMNQKDIEALYKSSIDYYNSLLTAQQ